MLFDTNNDSDHPNGSNDFVDLPLDSRAISKMYPPKRLRPRLALPS